MRRIEQKHAKSIRSKEERSVEWRHRHKMMT